MNKKNYKAPALDKGLDILELLSLHSDGLSQVTIASYLKKSVNEIYRMLSTLKHRKYIEFDLNTDQYKLSYKILFLSGEREVTFSISCISVLAKLLKISSFALSLNISEI